MKSKTNFIDKKISVNEWPPRAVRNALLLAFLFPLFASTLNCPAERLGEIRLWPNGAPGSEGRNGKEIIATNANGEQTVWSIHNPSLTPYLPSKEKATRTAILVIPGGGHRNLAITHEGYNVAQWLSDRGIAAFVLKHRLARETNSTYKIEIESFADTQRALRLIRSRAQDWNIEPTRLGAIGFSAGGELVNLACTRFDQGNQTLPNPSSVRIQNQTFRR